MAHFNSLLPAVADYVYPSRERSVSNPSTIQKTELREHFRALSAGV